jgi:hypothetical protein
MVRTRSFVGLTAKTALLPTWPLRSSARKYIADDGCDTFIGPVQLPPTKPEMDTGEIKMAAPVVALTPLNVTVPLKLLAILLEVVRAVSVTVMGTLTVCKGATGSH